MTASDIAALRLRAARAVTNRGGPDAHSAAVTAAVGRAFDDLARVLIPLIGHVGVDALAARAVRLAQREHPWLANTRDSDQSDGPLIPAGLTLEEQEPAIATAAAAAVLATFTGLLVTMIGKSLTARLMRQAWPDVFEDAGT
jgi:hypothetical protein